MEYQTVEQVFDDFKNDQIDRMTAIEVLQEMFNMSSLEAEARVESWEN
jgi:hypothetical protein